MSSAMMGAVGIFAAAYVAIATEKVDKTAAALLGASAVVLGHVVPYDVALHAVDLNVVLLLVGMMMVVQILASTGLFEWVAVTLARRSGGDGMKILLGFTVATALLSAVLDNVTTVILVAPITILICELLELPAVLFLILEAIASNIGGTSTLVGDPPNVLIASRTGLGFNDFILHLGPPVAILLVIGAAGLYVTQRKKVYVPDGLRSRVMKARPERAILEPQRLRRALVVFGIMLAGFFASHSLHMEPGIIALAGALVMALVTKVDLHHLLEKVEWNAVFFFIGLFMLIGALEHTGAIHALGEVLLTATGGSFPATVLAVLWFSAVASAVVDNIPLVIAFIPLLQSFIPAFADQLGVTGNDEAIRLQVEEPLYWALALGACLGGNGSLVGASANVVIAQIARKNGHPITFGGFTLVGAPVMVGTVAVSTVYIYVRYLM